jgi:3-hydroxymyristoyl/3-hydroxydecanoyl-(acyl carrier protein) dehydratase/NAD(P)-dependent dehydrogenase (short-subunit alcohol dehydrogenase family)
MLQGKNILIIGARIGGYGESIGRAAVVAGARVFGTSLNPEDPREQTFFNELGVELIDIPLRYDSDKRKAVFKTLDFIVLRLRERGVTRLDAVVHTVAGGFPRQPSVMKAVGDILKGKETFFDMATAVKRNVYYVNAGSFEDTINGLTELTDDTTQYIALTYRGDLPYFISHTKKHLENIALRFAGNGKRTIIAALPEAWTQSSQFFAGIEISVIHNYLNWLRSGALVSDEVAPAFSRMKQSLEKVEGLDRLLEELQVFLDQDWVNITNSSSNAELFQKVNQLFSKLRKEGTFPTLRKAVEAISDFVREACGTIVVREFLAGGKYEPGDVRQVYYRDLMGNTSIGLAKPREKEKSAPVIKRSWRYFEKDEIRRTLSMYGENFLFLDRVVMESGDYRNGMMGFGRFTVPTPEKNPILKDHFVGMPLFGGHLQMEAVAQFGTFMIMKLLKDRRLVPILTGTEFPDLNTMAPPGETLTMVGVIGFTDKRDLWMKAFIENRFARSKGLIRGMVLNERVVRKMTASFYLDSRATDDVPE